MSEEEKAMAVLAKVRQFIFENDIKCAESCYQMDHILEGSADFIESLCEIAGYAEDNDD